MQAFITKGCFTNHGGKIIEGDDSWLVDGKGVHLEGMGHFCPKCKKLFLRHLRHKEALYK